MDDQQDEYSLDSIALLCSTCARCVRDKRHPAMCVRNWDFGNINTLPKLSLLEILLIQRVRVFLHVAKLVDGKKQFALSGHCMAIPTDAAERIAQRRAWDVEENRKFPMNATHDTCGLSVMFVGGLDKWERIMQGSGPNDFKSTSIYKRIFQVIWDNIIIWLYYLKTNSDAYKDIVIVDNDPALKKQIENLPSQLLNKNNVHMASSEFVAQLEERTRANQPGAPQMDMEREQSNHSNSADSVPFMNNAEIGPNEEAIPSGHFSSFLVEPISIAFNSDEENRNQLKQAYNELHKAMPSSSSSSSSYHHHHLHLLLLLLLFLIRYLLVMKMILSMNL